MASTRRLARLTLPKLFVKYWLQLLAALAVPLTIAVVVEAWFAYRGQLEQIKRTQSVESLALTTAVEAGIRSDLEFLERLYRTPWPESRLENLAHELEISMSLLPSVLQVEVLQDGEQRMFVSQMEPTRLSAGPPPKPVSIPDRRLPRKAAQLSVATLGKQQIPVVAARMPSERFAGESMTAFIDLRLFSDLLAQSSSPDHGVTYLVGGDGRTIAHSIPALALLHDDKRALPHVSAAQAARDAGATMPRESVDSNGIPVLATVKPVHGTDWFLVIEQPLERVMAPVRTEAWRTLGLLLGSLLLAAVIGLLLAKRFARPILDLGEDVERIGRGELGHRSSVRTGDEIEALATQVNEMAARLEGYTEGLEKKVAERTEQLQAALRSRALFLAAASHDLRQPLYAISILADTLEIGKLDPESASILAKQREAISVLRTLFDNLLDLSRLDAHEIKPSIREANLRDILAPQVLEAEVLCHSKGLRFESDIAEARVLTDPELVRRVVGNLLSNAVRYTEAGAVRLTARVGADHAEILIADSGIGIAPEEHERIFDEFVQLDNSARDRDKGVGLGLSIVKRITQLLGIPLSLTSRLGEGSTFRIRLPLSPAAANADPGEAVTQAQARELAG